MRTYLAYKESNVEWIGEIPSHWVIKSLKHIKSQEPNSFVDGPFGSNLKTVHFVDDGDVFVIDSGFVTHGKFIPGKYKTITAEHFKTIVRSSCKAGDIIIAKIGARFGTSGILPDLGKPCVISGNSLKLTVNTESNLTKFIHYQLLHLKRSSRAFDLIVNTTAQPALSMSRMSYLKMVAPPLPEQQTIANFLDRKTAQIDTLIAKKQRQIELLQEHRTALINQAVSNGQDRRNIFVDNVPSPWLFSIPEGWKRKKLKLIASLKGRLGWQNLRADEYVEEGPLLVSSTHFNNGRIEWDRCNHVTQERFEMAPEIILDEQDVLFMKDGALMGKLAYVDELPAPACLNSHLLLMRPKDGDFFPRFLYYVLMSDFFEAYMIQNRTGTTFFGFSQQSMGNFPFTYPDLEKQIELCKYLDAKSEEIQSAIDATEQTIFKLNEYRTTIIAEAVTGKIDVRGY